MIGDCSNDRSVAVGVCRCTSILGEECRCFAGGGDVPSRRSWAAWVTTQNPTPKVLPDIKGKVNVITADGKPTVSAEM